MIDVILDMAGINQHTHDIVFASPGKTIAEHTFDVLIIRDNLIPKLNTESWRLWWDHSVAPRLHDVADVKIVQSYAITREIAKRNMLSQNQDNYVAAL